MDLGVRDRGYLIVGGTAGMGPAAAKVLAREGARVAVVGRHLIGPTRQWPRSRVTAVGAVAIVGDVTQRVMPSGRSSRPSNPSVGLAGVAVTTGTGLAAHTNVEHSTDDVWAEAFGDILMGTVRTVRAAIPHLVNGGGGTIVTTAADSIDAYHPARLPYVTLKSGVAAFTKTIARAYGPSGVRANCVCPGAIETDGLAAVRASLAKERGVPPEGLLEEVMLSEWHMDVALGRPGRPEEVGELFAFLLSPCGGYLTGAVVNIDGGTDF